MNTRRRGFSLVELLVVVAIIGILLAIVMPIYGRAKEKARQTDCASHLHAIVNAIRMYHSDWGGYPHPHQMQPQKHVDHGEAGPADPTSRRLSGAAVTLYFLADLDDPAGLRCRDDPTDPKDVVSSEPAVVPYDPENPFDPPVPHDPQRVFYTSYNAWPNPDTEELEQLYNWYGYNVSGRGLETLAEAGSTYSGVTDRLGQATWFGYVNASNPGTWTGRFPGLSNRNAPDTTVVTHCPWHRSQYRPTAALDIVAFLGGHVETRRVVQFDFIRQTYKGE